MKKPIILTILDGYGLREEKHGNAIQLADNKIFNYLWRKYPHTELIASGQEVGLPRGQMGNSEVGHMNIGAGRIVYQPLELINKAIENMEVEINEEITHEEIHRMINQYAEQLKMQGLSLEQYFEFTKTSMKELEKQMAPEAEKRVKERYLLEEIADAEKIEATDKDVEEDIERISKMYNVEKDEFVKMIGGTDMIKYDVRMRKALEFLKEN